MNNTLFLGESIMPLEVPIQIPNLTDSQKLYQAMVENLVSINTAVNDIQALQAKDHKILIEGNGELPLVEKVRNLETFTNSVRDSMRYWGRLIGGALLLNFIGFMIGIVLAIYRFLPILETLAKAQP